MILVDISNDNINAEVILKRRSFEKTISYYLIALSK